MLNYFALLLCEAIPCLCYSTDKGLLASDGRECFLLSFSLWKDANSEILWNFDLIKEWIHKVLPSSSHPAAPCTCSSAERMFNSSQEKDVESSATSEKWDQHQCGLSHMGFGNERKILADWHGSSSLCQRVQLQFFWLPYQHRNELETCFLSSSF